MLIVHVFVQVKPRMIEDFKAITLENAKASLKEPGIVRFDVIQEEEDSQKFVLVEVYKSKEDPGKHKQTEHYLRWKQAVEEMIEVPRGKKVYVNVFPDDEGWG